MQIELTDQEINAISHALKEFQDAVRKDNSSPDLDWVRFYESLRLKIDSAFVETEKSE